MTENPCIIILTLVGFAIANPADCQSEAAAKIQDYLAQLAADANQTDVRRQLAKVYLQIEAYGQAAAAYRHVIATEQTHRRRGFQPRTAEAFYGLGLASAGLEQFDEAIAAYQNALAIAPAPENPNCAHIHAALGSAYANTHRYEEALAAYQIAVDLQPDDAMIHHHLGTVYSKRGKRAEAMQHQLRAISLAPELATAHYQLGLLYAQQKQWDAAIAAYQTAYAHDAELLEALYNLAQAYRRNGDKAAAREQMKRFEERKSVLTPLHQLRGALQRTRDATARAQILTNIGRLYLKNGVYEKAAWEYQKAIGQNPKVAAAYNGIGIAYAMQGKYPEAIAAQQKALELKPDFAKAHAGLGFVYLTQNSTELALKHYRQAVALEPQFLEAHLKIGIILLNQKRYAEAVEAYQATLALNPNDAQTMSQTMSKTYHNLGQIYHNLGLSYAYQAQTDAALEALKKAVSLCKELPAQPPFLVETYHLIGELQAAQENFEAAETAYLASGLPKAYHALAQLYGKRGLRLKPHLWGECLELETAMRYAQKAIALNPNIASYYNTLALIAFRKGDYRQAEGAIRKAVELAPENRNYREGLKQILKR